LGILLQRKLKSVGLKVYTTELNLQPYTDKLHLASGMTLLHKITQKIDLQYFNSHSTHQTQSHLGLKKSKKTRI